MPAYATAIAMQDPSYICNLHHSSQQCHILNPLSEARDRTCVLMDASQIVSSEPRWEVLFFVFVLNQPTFLIF